MQRLYALGAGFNAFTGYQTCLAGRQAYPLDIGVFSGFGGRIIFAAQFDQSDAQLRCFSADSAVSRHKFVLKLLFS